MNRFKSIIFMFASLMLSASCEKDRMPKEEYLDVTPNNIAGEWQLVEWNGRPVNSDTYFYIELVRKDKEFTIYQNFDSMSDVPHVATGNYNIETDVERGAVIRGIYDYSGGLWTHSYEVDNLTKNSMTWKAVDDDDFVQKFVKTSIPSELR